MPMRLSTIINYTADFHQAVEHVVSMEAAGLDMVWVPEAYGFDAVSQLAYLAARTTRLTLGSGILSIYSRTPALLLQTAAGLDMVSGGRAVLGLGSSGPQVIEGWHGMPFAKPLSRTREIVELVRRGLLRQVLDYQGQTFALPLKAERGAVTGMGKPLKLVVHPVRERVPIYLGAIGPGNVALAAEVADGWLPFLYVPERAADVYGPSLARGAARRSTDLGPLEIVAGGSVAVGDDVERFREADRAAVALYVGGMGARGKNFYNDLVCRYGYEREARQIQDLYLAGQHHSALSLVPDELLRSISLIGSERQVRDRIAAFQASGVTNLLANPVGPDKVRTIERLRAWVDAA